jgi:ABC-type xylose transport system permease subunit
MRLACVSLVVMRILSRAKKRVANELGCSAMHADVKQTDFCFHLSVILLLGLVLNVALGWWWADPVSALIPPYTYLEGVSRFPRFVEVVGGNDQANLDTVEVWGSSPHVPTISSMGLKRTPKFSSP